MAWAYLLLGSNLGNKETNLSKARELIRQIADALVTESSVYESKPWGFEHPENFYNQVMHIETSLKPDELLNRLLHIEKLLGRVRKKIHYEARTIDIDILLYNMEIIRQEDIVVPHPRMHLRRFTLVPLAEIAPSQVHPIFKKTISTLLQECPDHSKVWKYTN